MPTLRPKFLIGVDSDGCVFDSMEVKQKRHFHPLIIRQWGLEAVEPAVRALAEYVNLHSPLRGSNRFVALLRTFELLAETNAVREAGIRLPDLEPFRAWVRATAVPNNDTLLTASKTEPALIPFLQWSLAVNRDIAAKMKPVPPFPGVKPALRKMNKAARVVVVSLTPHEALAREWKHHGIDKHANEVLGLESGPKVQQIRKAMKAAGISGERVMLIGDAPGDLQAALKAGVCFLPTIPGREAACWKRLLEEDLDRFLTGTYAGAVMARRVRAFRRGLSDTPPEEW